MTQGAEWGGEEARLGLQPERRRWEVSDCPALKRTVKRRTLLQKLVGWAGGWLNAAGVCNFACVSLCADVCASLMRRRMTDDQGMMVL